MYRSSILIDPLALRGCIQSIIDTKYGGCSGDFYKDVGISRTTIAKICSRKIMGSKVQDRLIDAGVRKDDMMKRKFSYYVEKLTCILMLKSL